jgi:hypothetical protein
MIVLTECQYFPSVILFKKVIEFSNVEFDIYDIYRKMSFRNRCTIAGGGGPVNLSIPLVDGRNQRKPLKEVRIDNKTGWQGQHWKTITSCYNRSPWFEFYKHDLENLYLQPADWLQDWNRKCWDWVVAKLGLEIQTRWSEGPIEVSRVGMPTGSGETKKDAMEATGIGILPGNGATNNKPAEAGVEPGNAEKSGYLDWRNKLIPRTLSKEFPEPIRYRQVFEDRLGFLPHLSILDLLFCEGRRTVEILESAKIPI